MPCQRDTSERVTDNNIHRTSAITIQMRPALHQKASPYSPMRPVRMHPTAVHIFIVRCIDSIESRSPFPISSTLEKGSPPGSLAPSPFTIALLPSLSPLRLVLAMLSMVTLFFFKKKGKWGGSQKIYSILSCLFTAMLFSVAPFVSLKYHWPSAGNVRPHTKHKIVEIPATGMSMKGWDGRT